MANELKILCSLQTAIAEADVRDDTGKLLAKAGDTLVILPQTVAGAILVEPGKTLAELWPTLSRTDHTHNGFAEALAGYQAELIRLSQRVMNLELTQIKNINGD